MDHHSPQLQWREHEEKRAARSGMVLVPEKIRENNEIHWNPMVYRHVPIETLGAIAYFHSSDPPGYAHPLLNFPKNQIILLDWPGFLWCPKTTIKKSTIAIIPIILYVYTVYMIHHKHHTQVATHAIAFFFIVIIDILDLVKHPAFPRAYSEILIPWPQNADRSRERTVKHDLDMGKL